MFHEEEMCLPCCLASRNDTWQIIQMRVTVSGIIWYHSCKFTDDMQMMVYHRLSGMLSTYLRLKDDTQWFFGC